MIPSTLTYKKATSVSEALQFLSEGGEHAKLLAGGHSLIPALKLRLNDHEYFIDVSKIDELKSIDEKNGHIDIGAMVTHDDIAKSSLLKEKVPMFPQGAELIGDVQVRNFGTIGGSIAHADPAADWPGLLLAAEATIQIEGLDSSRSISAEDFFQGLFMTDLSDEEMITSISVPVPNTNSKSAYLKFMQPASRFALVGCAVQVSLADGKIEKARVAFNGVSAKPFRDTKVEAALEGQPFTPETITNAASLAADDVSIMSDHYASQEYRRQMAQVFVERTLTSLT